MKATIKITAGDYGFSHIWTLVLTKGKQEKQLFLGPDVKVCNRLLGLQPRDVIEAIGTKDIENSPGNKRLADFIVSLLYTNQGYTKQSLFEMDAWELSVI